MWTSRFPSGERRGEVRRVSHVHARLRTTDVRRASPIEALIEERTPRGVRLTSKFPLLPEAVVILQPSGERHPLHARIVWARPAGAAWRAGCRVLGVSEPTSGAGDPALIKEPDAVAVRALAIAGLLALIVLFVYAA
ncbi:MAG TPA: hypothetical protein VF950_13475, partial [Planctomycetota bacterium]